MCTLTMIRLAVAYLLIIGVWLNQASVSAQVASPPVPPAVESNEKSNETRIQRVPLDAIVLLDSKGRNIYLPGGWPLNALDEFYNYILQNNQKNTVPPFTLRNVSATGTIVGNHVETDVQIELVTFGDQPVQIPLGFKEGIFPNQGQTEQPPLRYTGVGSAHLSVEPVENQYLAIIIPPSESTSETEIPDKSEILPEKKSHRHTLSFSIWLPLLQNGDREMRLPLSFPPSLHSQFLLDIPSIALDSSVSQGSILTAKENTEQQSTRLHVQGLRTNTEITWKKKTPEIINDRPVLLIEGTTIDVRLDTRMTVYDAVLPVSSATGSFESLQIRLPHGSILDRDMTDRYALVGNYSVSDVDEKSEVTVRFQQKTTGPVSIRLRVIQQFEEESPDFERELAGFEVLGAERQTGFLSVSGFPSEKKLYWEHVRNIHRVEEGSLPAVTSALPVVSSMENIRFGFTSQPFLLRVRVVSQQTRINVKPEYQFRISQGSIDMTARLSYSISGSQTDVLKIHMSDALWKCDCLSNLVDAANVHLDDSGELTIPLRNPMDGTFDIELRAFRSLPTEDTQTHRIILPLPAPQAAWCDPAPITIIPANNVEVEPIDESYSASFTQRTLAMTRQTRRMMPNRSDFLELQQEPLFYRSEPTGAVFVADLTYHRQVVHTSMLTDVRVFEDHNQITQTFVYNANYAPVDRLHFLIPDALLSSGSIQIRSGSQTLELRDSVVSNREDVPENWKRKMVQLPEPQFQIPLTFEYTSSPLSVPADGTTLCSLFFICPEEVPITEHRIHFFVPPDYTVELQDESKSSWEPFRETRRPSLEASRTFRSVKPPSKIALSISASEKSVSGIMIVERAWLQTWLTGEIRVDKATYLLKNTRDSVTLQLPPDAMLEHRIAVRINQQLIQPNVSLRGELILPILPEQQNRPVEVSVEYRYPFKMTSMEVPLILPTFAKDALIQYAFWQVVLQPDKHIIACSGGWTLEYNWTWNGLFWGRAPSIRKKDLGFESEDEIVDSKPSQYLFKHLQPSGSVTLYIVSRSLIVLCSSSLALFIGLVLIYVRQSRYAGSLFGLGILLLAVLLYQPPLVLLMLQASVFGVFLALGAGYIYRIFQRRQQWIPPAFPAFDEVSHLYSTVPPSQTVHEVIVDEGSASKDTPLVMRNNHNGPTANDQP